MRIGIFDPYLDTLGGGEKYILDIAEVLSKKNSVVLFWKEKDILSTVKERFNLDLSNVEVSDSFSYTTTLLKKVQLTRSFDIFFYVSDGSIPLLFSKKNILIMQFPVEWVTKKAILDSIKFSRISTVLVYSQFVKEYVDKTFKIHSTVLPPSVDNMYEEKTKKENMILTVGRFTKGMNTKKQEVLIEAFKKFNHNYKNWKFVLIGSYLPTDKDFVENLKSLSEGFPIELLTNISYGQLKGYYNRAKIYWHGAGFGEDLIHHPEAAEHFGITTIEAMSAGCVPVVFNRGGQREIVHNRKDGYTWNTEEELLSYTHDIISSSGLLSTLSKEAMQTAHYYSTEEFIKKLDRLI